MVEQRTISVQQGIWIDKQRLAEAGLQDRLQITVQPGEIRIQSAESASVVQGELANEPLLNLSGTLSGLPLSGHDIERELYGGQAAQ